MRDIIQLALILTSRQKRQSRTTLLSIIISISVLSALFALTGEYARSLVEENALLSAISILVLFISTGTIVIAMHNLVLHRTHQIGIMKAIGATNKKIMLLVLSESVLLGFIGGLVGILISHILLLFFTFMVNTSYLLPTNSIFTSAGTLVLGVLIGSVAGWLSTRSIMVEKPARIIRRI